MTETMDAVRSHMVAAETIRAGNILAEVCRPIEGGKFHRYEKGWDDKRVAAETSERLNEGHITRLRRALEMKLEPNVSNLGKTLQSRLSKYSDKLDGLVERQTEDFKDLDGRITDYKAATAEAFAELHAKVDLLIEAHNKVCDELSLNKVHDLRAHRLVLE